MMMYLLFLTDSVGVYGVILLILGLLLRLIVGRSRFNRRGVGGLQQFRSYSRTLVITAFERLIRLIGTLLIWGGLFLCFVAWYNQRTADQFRRQQSVGHAR